MAHEYPILTRILQAWLSRDTKGPRCEEDYVVEAREGFPDSFVFSRYRGYAHHHAFAWRVKENDRDCYFIAVDQRDDRKSSAIFEIIQDHAKAKGEGFVALELGRVRRALGIDKQEFGNSERLKLRLIEVRGTEWGAVTLLAYGDTRLLCQRGFAVRVPASTATIDDAFALLVPPAAREAQQQGLPHFRHGNWYLIRRTATPLTASDRKGMTKNFGLPEKGREPGHFAGFGTLKEGRVFVSGMLRHTRRHFLQMQLDGLWEAVTAVPAERG
jgi:hypothetical protein